MNAYRIVDWDRRYEVHYKGRESQEYIPMEVRRKSPLRYVRMPVHGLQIGPGLDELFTKGWRPGELVHWAAFGIFHKLLEIAADQPREQRGWLLDSDGMPLTPGYFAKRFHEIESTKLIEEVFELLVSVGWIEIVEIEKAPGSFRAIPGDSGSLYNYTDTETDTETERSRKKAQTEIAKLFESEHQRAKQTANR